MSNTCGSLYRDSRQVMLALGETRSSTEQLRRGWCAVRLMLLYKMPDADLLMFICTFIHMQRVICISGGDKDGT
jgi:hypothetical protein